MKGIIPYAHDNIRGSRDQPCGFVYLAENGHGIGRIGYAYTSSLEIFNCKETPNGVNIDVLHRVRRYIKQQFPHLPRERDFMTQLRDQP